jgi:hypothetical protein
LSGLINKKTLVALFAGVFFLEAALSFWTGPTYDMKVWFNTGSWLSQGINIYLPSDHIGYPPLWAFWCLVAYRLYGFFGNSIEVWRFVLKLPLILSQLVLAYVIGRFAQSRFNQKTARRIFLWTLTWSFFFYIGVLFGQINILSALLTFLAFYAVTAKRNGVGALLLGAAITLKIYPLIILPAFLFFVLKKQNKTEAGKFLFISCAVPIVFTFLVFSAFHWDILYFLRTIFYWTPILETKNPVLMQGGCMNVWSFFSLLNVDISQVWLLRFLWIPVVAAGSIYWLRKPTLEEPNFNLSIISIYILFLVTYGWVTEQMFIDPLPFIFLQIIAFRPKRSQFFFLVFIQILVFAFSAANWGVFIFEPFVARFYPPLVSVIQMITPGNPIVWNVRGALGLAVSLSLTGFLAFLMRPSIGERFREIFLRRISSTFHSEHKDN